MAVKTLILLALGASAQRSRLDVHTENDNDTRSDRYLNVYGAPLKKCSGPGMALTGFTREGTCTDRVDDAGSHHICIEMDSVDGGNFCEVTASRTGRRSHAVRRQRDCPVQHWCVCEWAFAPTSRGPRMRQMRHRREATNRWAYLHYQRRARGVMCLAAGLGGMPDWRVHATSMAEKASKVKQEEWESWWTVARRGHS